MKKLIFAGLIALMPLCATHAQSVLGGFTKNLVGSTLEKVIQGKQNSVWRPQYTNFAYTKGSLQLDGKDYKGKYGANFVSGRTFFLHKPVGNVFRIGIDLTWTDINYVAYNYDVININSGNYALHELEYSMGLGPSISFLIKEKFKIHGYYRFAPTAAGHINMHDKDVNLNYATMWLAGMNLSYKVFGLGAECKWGKTTYKCIGSEGPSIDGKINQLRAYINFRF